MTRSPLLPREARLLSLAERQREFADAILHPDAALPQGLTGPARSVGAERFEVYRNNVAVGLIEALRSGFPVVNRLVGDAFFTAMAGIHALRCPPASPVLLAYGADFADFIAGFDPVADLPYLADVARLEWLWLDAYHAADAAPLPIDDLSSLPTDRLPGLRLGLHPAVRFRGFAHPARTLWGLHQDGGEPGSIELANAAEQVLITRPGADVAVTGLSPGALRFLEAIRDGSSIADGAALALEDEPALHIAPMLRDLFAAGAFAGFTDPDQGETA